jgi:polyadenylate-binding protein
VRGFDESLSEEALERVFREFGEIENVKIQRDENGISKKFGYVCFANLEDAQKCISQSPLLRFPETGKQVYVADMIPSTRKRQMNLQNKNQQARAQNEARAPLPPDGAVPAMPFMRAGREPRPYQVGPVGPAAFQGLPPGIASAIPGLPGQAIGAPGAYVGLPPGPNPFLPASNPKDRVRQEILDQTAGNPQQQSQLLGRLKELSDDQALRLTRDQALLIQWMRQG